MKRWLAVAAVILLSAVAAACAGSEEPAEDDGGIAALEESRRDEGKARRSDGKSASRKSDEREQAERKKADEDDEDDAGAYEEDPAAEHETRDAEGGDGGPAAAAPIPASRYDYATDGTRTVSGRTEPMPEVTWLTAESPRGAEQRQVRDLRDADGNGTVTESRLLYRPDGVFLTYVKVTATFPGGLTDVREFRLPEPELVGSTGARPGFSRAFSMQGSGTRARVAIDARRFEVVAVGGKQVRALVVATRITFSGAIEGEQKAASWFWPKHVMPLKERVSTDVTNGPVRFQSDYEAVLRRLP